jgi:hypothetical protein
VFEKFAVFHERALFPIVRLSAAPGIRFGMRINVAGHLVLLRSTNRQSWSQTPWEMVG